MNNQQFKADAGKAMPDLLEMGFPHALRLIQATLEYGAQKYQAHSWHAVDDGVARYTRAGRRHRQERDLDSRARDGFHAILESTDEESGLPHIAHELFNLMALIELEFAKVPAEYRRTLLASLCKFNPPPTAHKQPVQEDPRLLRMVPQTRAAREADAVSEIKAGDWEDLL